MAGAAARPGGLTLPAQVVINEFYRLEGDKFSTSRGHAIWGGEFLRRVNADALRFHLCLTGPERAQNNFSMKEFADTLSTVLAGGLERWTDTVLDLLAQDFDSVVPAAGPADGPLAAERAALPGQIAGALGAEAFSPQRAADVLATVIERADADLRELALLRVSGPREEYAGRLAAHAELLAAVAVTAAPLMPGWSAFLAGHLGLPVDLGTRMPEWAGVEGRLLAEGTTLPTATPLFFHELS